MNKNLEIVNERAKILERPSKIKQCNNLQRDLVIPQLVVQ